MTDAETKFDTEHNGGRWKTISISILAVLICVLQALSLDWGQTGGVPKFFFVEDNAVHNWSQVGLTVLSGLIAVISSAQTVQVLRTGTTNHVLLSQSKKVEKKKIFNGLKAKKVATMFEGLSQNLLKELPKETAIKVRESLGQIEDAIVNQENSEIIDLKHKIKALEEERADLLNRKDSDFSQHYSKLGELVRIGRISTLGDLDEKVLVLEEKLRKAQEACRRVEDENVDYSRKIDEKMERIEAFVEQIDTLKTENHKLKEQVDYSVRVHAEGIKLMDEFSKISSLANDFADVLRVKA